MDEPKAPPSRLQDRPEAKILKVEDLLKHALQGRLRVPHFQRPLRWRSEDIVALFDSIYRGYPIGDLLFLQRDAGESSLTFGPRGVAAAARPDAWLIIDGQQRIVALVGALLHPEPRPQGDIYAIWFDLERETFHWAPQGASIPDLWIPVRALGDSRELHRWWSQWPLRGEREELLDRIYDVSKLLREYEIPSYILRNAPEDAVRTVFQRINSRGTQMLESEVFNALNAIGEPRKPLATLAEALAPLGYGALGAKLALRCVKAATGVDPAENLSDGRALDMEEVAAAIGRGIRFLQGDVGIPHLKVSPYFVPLLILSRFFAVHPSPDPRDRLLLRRWVWRGFLNGAHAASGHANVRRLQGLIEPGDASTAAKRLLDDLGTSQPERSSSVDPRRAWVGTAAEVRLAQIALLHMGARSPLTGEALKVEDFRRRLDDADAGAVFVRASDSGEQVVAGRFLLLGGRAELRALQRCADAEILASHGLSAEAQAAWRRGDVHGMIGHRSVELAERFDRFFGERADWLATDRASIRALVAAAARSVDGRA